MNRHAHAAAARRDEILKLVRDAGPITSQGALREALRERGWRVAQPTLSRDLRELGLARTPAGYVAPGDLPGLAAAGVSFAPAGVREGKLEQRVRFFVTSVRRAGSLVVIRTPPAAADAVARAIDEAGHSDIVGTIAGDDTIFVAAATPTSARKIAQRFLDMAAAIPRKASRR